MTQGKKNGFGSTMQQENDGLKKKLQESANTIYRLKKENELLSGKEEELEKLKDQTRSLSKRAIAQAKLVLKYQEMQRYTANLLKQKDAKNNLIQTLQEQVRALQLQVNNKQQVIKNKQTSKTIDSDAKDKTIATLEQRLRAVNLQIEQYERRQVDFKSQLEQKDDRIALVQKDIETLKTEARKMHAQKQSMCQQLKSVKSKQDKISKANQNVSSQNSKLKRQNTQLREQNVKLSNQYNGALEELNRAQVENLKKY